MHDLLCVFPGFLPIIFGRLNLVPYLTAFARQYHHKSYESDSKEIYPPHDRDGVFDRYTNFISTLN